MSDQQTKGGFTGDPAAALTVAGRAAVAATRRRRPDFLATEPEHRRPRPCCGTSADAQAAARAAAPTAKAEAVAAGEAAADDHAGHLERLWPDGARMAATVATLAGDPFAGRRVGTAGGAAARGLVAGRLADLGAEVTLEPFPVRSVPDVYATPTVGGTTAELPRARRSAATWRCTSPRPTTPLLRRRGPWSWPAGETRPGGGCWCRGHEPVRRVRARRRCARAVGRPGSSTGTAGSTRCWPARTPVPAGRWPSRRRAARRWSRRQRAALVRPATRRCDGRRDRGQRARPVPRRPPPAGVDLLLTAHYDGVGDHPGLRQPGAADNGSGVAVVLRGRPAPRGGTCPTVSGCRWRSSTARRSARSAPRTMRRS